MKSKKIKPHKYYIEDIKVGQKIKFSKRFTQSDVNQFAEISGDKNPVHLDENFAENTIFKKKIVHGFLTASLISAAIGTKLPGPGSIYLNQSLKFLAPVFPNDKVIVELRVKTINLEKNRVIIDTKCKCDEKNVLIGEAEILVESKKNEAN